MEDREKVERKKRERMEKLEDVGKVEERERERREEWKMEGRWRKGGGGRRKTV